MCSFRVQLGVPMVMKGVCVMSQRERKETERVRRGGGGIEGYFHSDVDAVYAPSP